MSAGPSGRFFTQGTFCEVPVRSTGAGDRFNAGYCLVLGSAVCGFFVRNARSPSRTEVLKLLRQWAEEDLQRARDGVLDYLTFKK